MAESTSSLLQRYSVMRQSRLKQQVRDELVRRGITDPDAYTRAMRRTENAAPSEGTGVAAEQNTEWLAQQARRPARPARPARRPREPEISADRLNELSLAVSRGSQIDEESLNARERAALANIRRRASEMPAYARGGAVPKAKRVGMPPKIKPITVKLKPR